jgi:hypothetical protein
MPLVCITMLATLCAAILFGRWLGTGPKTLSQAIPLVKAVDIRDLRDLLDPALDTYLSTFLPATNPFNGHEIRVAQKNRIVLTRQHFNRLFHNASLFRQVAKGESQRIPNDDPDPTLGHITQEIFVLATKLRHGLFMANVKLFAIQLFGCYSYYGSIDGIFLTQQYCRLTERVLMLSRTYGHCYYDNLLAALCHSVPEPEFIE